MKSLKFTAYIIIAGILPVKDWMLYLSIIVHLWELLLSPVRSMLIVEEKCRIKNLLS